MRILIIVDDYLPKSTKIAAKMMHDLATKFIELGHTVSVITPDAEITSKKCVDYIDDVQIYRFKSGEIKISDKVKRAINESLLSLRAWRFLKKDIALINPDLIVYYSPSIFFGTFVKKIKEKYHTPCYLVLRDFFPQWVIDNGIISDNSLIARYFRFFEKINYEAADVIGIQSPKNLEWFKNNTNTGKKLELLYNWALIKESDSNRTQYREEFKLENKIIFFYGGNIGKAQDLMSIVRLAENLQEEKDAYFLIMGSGEEYSHIQDEIIKRGLGNISIHPPISQNDFQVLLSEIDIGIFTLDYNHNTHNFPGKLLGYMAESKPILGCVNPGNDLKKLIESKSSGFISITGEDQILAKNAMVLLKDHSLRLSMGSHAKQLLVDVFSIETAANQILNSVCCM